MGSDKEPRNETYDSGFIAHFEINLAARCVEIIFSRSLSSILSRAHEGGVYTLPAFPRARTCHITYNLLPFRGKENVYIYREREREREVEKVKKREIIERMQSHWSQQGDRLVSWILLISTGNINVPTQQVVTKRRTRDENKRANAWKLKITVPRRVFHGTELVEVSTIFAARSTCMEFFFTRMFGNEHFHRPFQSRSRFEKRQAKKYLSRANGLSLGKHSKIIETTSQYEGGRCEKSRKVKVARYHPWLEILRVPL